MEKNTLKMTMGKISDLTAAFPKLAGKIVVINSENENVLFVLNNELLVVSIKSS